MENLEALDYKPLTFLEDDIYFPENLIGWYPMVSTGKCKIFVCLESLVG